MQFYNSTTFKDSGLSYVTIKYKNKFFTGKAKCHKDDPWSEITGCRFAEKRAIIKALKDEWKQKKEACEECRKFVNAVMQYKDFDKESSTAKAMFKQLNCRIKEVNDLADRINSLEFNLRVSATSKEAFERKLKKIKKG